MSLFTDNFGTSAMCVIAKRMQRFKNDAAQSEVVVKLGEIKQSFAVSKANEKLANTATGPGPHYDLTHSQ